MYGIVPSNGSLSDKVTCCWFAFVLLFHCNFTSSSKSIPRYVALGALTKKWSAVVLVKG